MKIARNQGGQTVVFVALLMALVAFGFLAFALDVGSLLREKRMAQAAADGAALAAAEELTAGNSSNEQAVANAVAKLNGFDTTLATNPATVTLATPATGNYTGSAYVTATVSRPIPTLFMAAFSHVPAMTVSAQSTAGGGQTSPTCVCLESGSGQDLNMSNNSKLAASTCGLVDNSSSSNAIGVVGGSTLTSLSVGTVSSTWNNSGNINNGGSIASSHIVQGITSTCSPAMPAAPGYSSCSADPGGSYGTYTFGPANPSTAICYTALTVGANGSTVTLNPGIYVITTGALHFESGSGGKSNLGGQGVFFYLTGTASLMIDNGANVNLVSGGATESGGGTAPAVGSYGGILVYQASSDTAALSIQGGSTTYLNGALYAPSAAVNLGNGSGAIVDAPIVASSLSLSGGGTLNVTAGTNEGALTLTASRLVQ